MSSHVISSIPSGKSLDQWNISDVISWLQSINMARYCAKFRIIPFTIIESLAVDGAMLLEMKESDLENDLGIGIRLHRIKILESLAILNGSKSPILKEANLNLNHDNKKILPKEENNLEENKVVSKEEDKVKTKLSLKALEVPLVDSVFEVLKSGANLGRHNSTNEIVIPESIVSRKHCRVFYDDKGCFVEDVGSTTGTFIMLKAKTALRKGI